MDLKPSDHHEPGAPGFGQAAPPNPASPPQDLAADSARLLADAALALFAIYGVVVAFDLLPPRLTDPLWLFTASTALVNAVSIPLVGVVCVHLAGTIAPYANWIHLRRLKISRLAALASLGFLLLVPLLGFATWRGIANVNAANQKQTLAYVEKARTLLQGIDRSSSPRQLQQSMAALQGPQLPDQELGRPLAELKQAARQAINQAVANSLGQLPNPKSEAYKPLYTQTFRTALLCFVSSIAFAAVSWDPLKSKSLLQKVLSKLSFSSGPASPSLAFLIKKRLRSLQTLIDKDPERSKRLAEMRVLKKEADRAQARREREMKQNLARQKRDMIQQRKKTQQFEKQRLLAEKKARQKK